MPSIDFDVADYIDDLSDDELLEEVAARGLDLGEQTGDLIREAYNELRGGRPAEALAILDRLLYPKWHSRSESLDAYTKQQQKLL